jgi:phosphoglycolate phosphatase
VASARKINKVPHHLKNIPMMYKFTNINSRITTKKGKKYLKFRIYMKFRAVIFDIDGTLLDTLQDIADSANRALVKLGFAKHQLGAYKYFVGDGMEALATRILPKEHREESTIAKMIDGINSEYSQHWADTTRPYEGITELLQELTDRGIKFASLSNKPDDSAVMTVSKLLPQYRFEFVFGVNATRPRKPDPSGALEISRKLHIPPEEFLYLGDTNTDMLTATAAGMYAVGVLWGFRTAEELLTSGARLLISKPLEVLKML